MYGVASTEPDGSGCRCEGTNPSSSLIMLPTKTCSDGHQEPDRRRCQGMCAQMRFEFKEVQLESYESGYNILRFSLGKHFAMRLGRRRKSATTTCSDIFGKSMAAPDWDSLMASTVGTAPTGKRNMRT